MEMVCCLNLLQQKQLQKPSLPLGQRHSSSIARYIIPVMAHSAKNNTTCVFEKRTQVHFWQVARYFHIGMMILTTMAISILFVYSFIQVEHEFITEERYISGVLPFFSCTIKSSWNATLSTLAYFEMDSCNDSSLLNLGNCKHLINFEKPCTYIKGLPKTSGAIVYN
jgi:hypothetical protein